MSFPWNESQHAFAEAAAVFVDLTAAVGGRWEEPGLGEWDIRALVGHTTRSFLTVETYLQRPAAAVDVPTTADYYRATRSIAAGPEVAERGRAAGRALGENPAGAVAEISARVVELVRSQDGSAIVTTVAGGMRLADYLPTRTFELTVHGSDLAVALGKPAELGPAASSQALRILEELAVADGVAAPVLLALTGRTGLPAGFTLL